MLAQVPDLSAFSSLRHLELSYNAIHSLAPLKTCGATRLEELYAASNKISEAGLTVHWSMTFRDVAVESRQPIGPSGAHRKHWQLTATCSAWLLGKAC